VNDDFAVADGGVFWLVLMDEAAVVVADAIIRECGCQTRLIEGGLSKAG